MSSRKKAAPAVSKQQRKRRARPTPRWLLRRQDLDQVAQRRCLLVLSVLSGQTPVSDAIEAAQISRPLYYQLEERALKAMLSALTPGSTDDSVAESPAKRIAQLEQKVSELEQDNRRAERLLLLTRKVMKGPVKMASGRPPKARPPSSTSTGRKRSRVSKAKAPASESLSTSMPVGASEPHAGIAS